MPDPRFEKFREITLGEKTLNKAIEVVQNTDPRPSDTPERSATQPWSLPPPKRPASPKRLPVRASAW